MVTYLWDAAHPVMDYGLRVTVGCYASGYGLLVTVNGVKRPLPEQFSFQLNEANAHLWAGEAKKPILLFRIAPRTHKMMITICILRQ